MGATISSKNEDAAANAGNGMTSAKESIICSSSWNIRYCIARFRGLVSLEHMKKNQLVALAAFILFALIILALVPPPARTGESQAPQGSDIYEGITPCADCEGIVTRLALAKDAPYSAEGTYELSLTYLGRDVAPYVSTGLWTTERGTPADPDATVFVLDPDLPDRAQRYLRVDATTIRQLDRDGNEIDASLPFSLTRISGPSGEIMPERRTVSGTSICLPHKDQTGPQTLECMVGFQGDDGNNYGLDFTPLESGEARMLVESGVRVEVEGVVTPIEMLSSDHWMKYDAAGIISVTSVRPL